MPEKAAREKSAGAETTSGKRELSSATEKLRAMCKRATIGIAPSIYVKNKTDQQLRAALEELLSKHGLSKSSGMAQHWWNVDEEL